MHASLVWFTLLAPCIYAAPLPINQIDSLLASISKQISKAIPINNIPTALATKPSTMVRVVVNPKIVPNPKTTPKLGRSPSHLLRAAADDSVRLSSAPKLASPRGTCVRSRRRRPSRYRGCKQCVVLFSPASLFTTDVHPSSPCQHAPSSLLQRLPRRLSRSLTRRRRTSYVPPPLLPSS